VRNWIGRSTILTGLLHSCVDAFHRLDLHAAIGEKGVLRLLYVHTATGVQPLVNVEQLKNSVNRMSVDVVREAVLELRLDGLVTEGKTPFNKLHFNTCFAEIEALFQRAGYHKQLDVVGYQGLLYALYDPGRWEAVEVLRWLKEFTEAAARRTTVSA
jgi:hypothetical protein